jgi:hypothetical protein
MALPKVAWEREERYSALIHTDRLARISED